VSLVPNSRRAAALSPVGARDCVEGQRSRKRGAYMVLAHQTRLRAVGGVPWEAWADVNVAWRDVRPTRRAAAVRSRSVGQDVANLAHAAAATWDRPPAGALDWDSDARGGAGAGGAAPCGLSLGPLPAQRLRGRPIAR